jgi:hypothetical protein
MNVGFSVMKKDNVWILKVQNTCTQGSFGTLAAAMRCAYQLANETDWETASYAEALGGCEARVG